MKTHNIPGKVTLPTVPLLGTGSKFLWDTGTDLKTKFDRIRAQMNATKIVAIKQKRSA